MPSMKNKNGYESQGLMRRFLKKTSSFRSLGGDSSVNDSGSFIGSSGSFIGRVRSNEGRKWRPRKNQFQLLDGDDDDNSLPGDFQENDSSAWNVQPVVSQSESELGDYRREIMFEKKATALKKTPIMTNKKRELSPLKPPGKDSSSKNPLQKMRRTANKYQQLSFSPSEDTFSAPTTDPFGFETIEKSNSATSDPTDFFSKEQTSKLTMGNLEKMNSVPNMSSPAVKGAEEKTAKERKFYQFTVDEDKTSTVVESSIKLPADYPGGEYSIDELSCDETSQGTRIQRKEKREPNEISVTSSHSRTHANEVKEFDAFFTEMDQGKNEENKFDDFFPPSDKDEFFPSFGGKKELQRVAPPTPGTDISSSFGGDKYFDVRNNSSNTVGQSSNKSLAYSISPVHQKKTPVVRQPLSSKNSRRSSSRRSSLRKSNEWFAPKNNKSQFDFDDFPPPPSASMKKRYSSVGSSKMQAPPADPFDSTSNDKFSAKENVASKANKYDAMNKAFSTLSKHRPSLQKEERIVVRNAFDENDLDEATDAFDEVGNWEKPAPTTIGKGVRVQDRTFALNRARIARQSYESQSRPSKNKYIDDDYDVDVRSVASGFEVAPRRSMSKPLGLPSNAIMASMLFQTKQYGIDQNDVAAKINAIEKENSRQRKVRHSQGGIPDAVNTDDDYMTTVSSFSDTTSAYMQEAWKKSSSDFMNNYTSARALDMDYRRAPVRTRPESRPQRILYEA